MDWPTDSEHTSPVAVFVIKNFNSAHTEDTIIFKQYVHEDTFPNYPDDSTEPMVNYLVICSERRFPPKTPHELTVW